MPRGPGRARGEVQVSSRQPGGGSDTGVVSGPPPGAARRKLGPARAALVHGAPPGGRAALDLGRAVTSGDAVMTGGPTMAEQGDGTTTPRTESHDPDFPEA